MRKQFKHDVVILSRAWHDYRQHEEFCLSDKAREAYGRFWDLLEATATKYDVDLHALAGCIRIY
jgi:hypothetical protein